MCICLCVSVFAYGCPLQCAEVAKCQETSYSGKVSSPHHALLTLESLLDDEDGEDDDGDGDDVSLWPRKGVMQIHIIGNKFSLN